MSLDSACPTGVPGLSTCVNPGALAVDDAGNLYYVDSFEFGSVSHVQVRVLRPDGVVYEYAGNYSGVTDDPSCGFGGSPLNACFRSIDGLAVSPDRNELFISGAM